MNDAFTEQVEKAALAYADGLARLAFTYVKSLEDAEDIVQDVFLSYLKTKPELAGAEHEKAWLIRATINRSKDVLKSAWVKKKVEPPAGTQEDGENAYPNGWPPIGEDLSYLEDEKKDVLEAVLSLDEKYRLPIHLHYYGGYSINEIAAYLDEKPATIGTRLSRGRDLLREALSKN